MSITPRRHPMPDLAALVGWPADLLAQAKMYEDFGATQQGLEPDQRLRFWRAAFALRFLAYTRAQVPATATAVAEKVAADMRNAQP